jgi:O-antigen ligase
MFFGRMATPVSLLSFLTTTLPVKLSIAEMITFAGLLMGGRAARTNRARPMDRTILASVGTVALWWLYGLATGGMLNPTYTQIRNWVSALLLAWSLANFNRTGDHFLAIGKVVLYAALYRSLSAITFYLVAVRNTDFVPPLMTTHGDTVLFVVALLLLLSYAIEVRTRGAIALLMLAAPIILVAIQLNNRRLAWASLGGGVPVLYALLPSGGRFTRRLNRILLLAAPIVLLYVAVGWGRTERVFKPLAAFASMGGGKVDASTKARDNENMGLISMVQDSPFIGTGWGHQWREVDSTYTVPTAVFPMYHYLPHNTIAAMLAFCGLVGFAGTWMVFPVSAFLNARTYRVSRNPIVRVAGATGVVQVVVCTNQMFGDMGLIDPTVACIMATGIAAAARLSVSSGAWPQSSRRRPKNHAPTPGVAEDPA